MILIVDEGDAGEACAVPLRIGLSFVFVKYNNGRTLYLDARWAAPLPTAKPAGAGRPEPVLHAHQAPLGIRDTGIVARDADRLPMLRVRVRRGDVQVRALGQRVAQADDHPARVGIRRAGHVVHVVRVQREDQSGCCDGNGNLAGSGPGTRPSLSPGDNVRARRTSYLHDLLPQK